jgi:uncharacterized protein (TIGR03437 family)
MHRSLRIAAVAALTVLPAAAARPAPNARTARLTLQALPWRFEPNRGQAPADAAFVARGADYEVLISAQGPVMRFRRPGGKLGVLGTVIRNGNRRAVITGERPSTAHANYIIGNQPEKWLENIGGFDRVRYADVYPSIDLVFYGNERSLEFDFEVKPGGDPSRIELSWTGAGKVRKDSEGNLLIPAAGGDLRWAKPVIYQTNGGARAEVAGGFRLHNNIAAFDISGYDRSRTLIIDPAIAFSTYLGGAGNDSVHGVAVDGSGNILVAGVTSSTSLPTTSTVAQPGYSGSSQDTITGDAFVASLNPSGAGLNWITYLGGNGDDLAYGIVVDVSGNPYITGMTNSLNFPVKNAAFGSFLGAGGNKLNPLGDAFLVKLNTSGQIAYSTYFGGSADDWGMAVAVDGSSAAYIAGFTLSTNLPVGASSWQKGYKGNGGNPDYCTGCGPVITSGDAFAAKFDANGKLVWTTYVGGSKDDFATSIAVDKTGVYLAGSTQSADFPVSAGAFQTQYGGASNVQAQPNMHMGDGFVVKLDLNGANLLYGTYLGGSGDDGIYGLAVDSNGAAYVTGATVSPNLPISTGAFQSAFKGPASAPLVTGHPTFVYGDGFAAKLNPTGTALVYSTYFGGSGDDVGQSIAVDAAGNAYITGQTTSKDFPITGGAIQSAYAGDGGENQAIGDAFLLQLDPKGGIELYATYLGGSRNDAGAGIAIDANGNAWIAGYTLSQNFPTSKGAFQTAFAGSNRLGIPYGDAFVAKISGLSTTSTTPAITPNGVVPVYSSATTLQPGSWFSIYGNNLASATTVWNGNFPTNLGGTTVSVNGKSAYLWFVSAGQINAQAPDDTATGSVPVTVTTSAGSATSTVNLAPAGAAFLLLPDGKHVTGIIITPNGGGSQGGGTYDLLGPTAAGTGFRPAKRGESIAIYGVGFGPTNPPVPAGQPYTCPAAGCASLVTMPQVTIGGAQVVLAFGGIVSAGLYQFNFTVPSTIGTGDQPIVATVNGVQTQPSLVIPVQ